MNISNLSRPLVGAVVGVVIGYGLSLYFKNPQDIVEVVKYQDRVRVVKQVIERPDGTKETIETIEKETKVDQRKEVTNPVPDWNVAIGTSVLRQGVPVYTVQVQRRILGSFYAGAYGRSDTELGVMLSFQF